MRLEHRSPPHTNGSRNGSSSQTNGSAKGTETNGYHTNGASQTVTQDRSPFHGHDREEVTRILLQSLSDLGYRGAAEQLSRESKYELEIPSVAAFRSAVLNGEWDEAEALLFGIDAPSEVDGGGVALGNGHPRSLNYRRRSRGISENGNGYAHARGGLPLAEGADTTSLKFLLRQQKYLELLEDRDIGSALSVLRLELTPLKRDIARLHALSSLMMCQTSSDLRSQANWDGANGSSRGQLLSDISRHISPSVMIPEHRLATLLTSVQQEQILNCRYHNTTLQPSLYTDHACSADDFPLQTLTELRNHTDEIWFVAFSPSGALLATAGKDGLVCVYSTANWKLVHEFREHVPPHRNSEHATQPHIENRGVCYVAFSPDDSYLISCSQANEFVVLDVRSGRIVSRGDHFDYPVTTAAWLPDSETFVVGTQGSRRPLGMYSLRPSNGNGSSSGVVRNNEIYSFRDPPWDPQAKDHGTSFRITDCAVSAAGDRLVATTIDNRILSWDLSTPNKRKVAEWIMEDKLTSINFSADGRQLLVNMNEGRLLALNSYTGEVEMSYAGARQVEFVIRSCFGGAGEGFVVSGSEDSRVYIWRRQTGMQVASLEAHGPGTVNAVAWHPGDPAVWASAGDDRRVRM